MPVIVILSIMFQKDIFYVRVLDGLLILISFFVIILVFLLISLRLFSLVAFQCFCLTYILKYAINTKYSIWYNRNKNVYRTGWIPGTNRPPGHPDKKIPNPNLLKNKPLQQNSHPRLKSPTSLIPNIIVIKIKTWIEDAFKVTCY